MARDFSLLQSVWTSSGVHPACYSMGIMVKWLGHEVEHSPPSMIISAGWEIQILAYKPDSF